MVTTAEPLLLLQSPPPRPPRTHRQSAKSHYSSLAHTIGEERKEKDYPTQKLNSTFKSSSVDSAQSDTNPYIAGFVRSMSHEGEKVRGRGKADPSTATSRETGLPSSSPYVESVVDPTTSRAAEGSAVKRRRITGCSIGIKGHHRAVRPSPSLVRLKELQKDLEGMKISPDKSENQYVKRIDRVLQQHYSCRDRPRPRPRPAQCPKQTQQAFHNQYIVGYHQRLLKRHRICQRSRPNHYVVQLHRR